MGLYNLQSLVRGHHSKPHQPGSTKLKIKAEQWQKCSMRWWLHLNGVQRDCQLKRVSYSCKTPFAPTSALDATKQEEWSLKAGASRSVWAITTPVVFCVYNVVICAQLPEEAWPSTCSGESILPSGLVCRTNVCRISVILPYLGWLSDVLYFSSSLCNLNMQPLMSMLEWLRAS